MSTGTNYSIIEERMSPAHRRLHPSTYEYLKPDDEQIRAMAQARSAARVYSQVLEDLIPDGPDKTYILRRVRETAMWVNVALTRFEDGTPRTGAG